jgi:hypothetical protein
MIASDTLEVPCRLGEGGAANFFESIDINSSAIFGDAFVVLFHCRQAPNDIGR